MKSLTHKAKANVLIFLIIVFALSAEAIAQTVTINDQLYDCENMDQIDPEDYGAACATDPDFCTSGVIINSQGYECGDNDLVSPTDYGDANCLADPDACIATDSDGDGFYPPQDCDDTNALINPNAAEVCDNLDNNCNGIIDEYCKITINNITYACKLNDSVDPSSYGAENCEDDPDSCEVDVCADNDNDGYAAEGGECGPIDCDDNNANIHPGADDSNCNGIDENCDGTADDGYVPAATSCGLGVCASTGILNCADGIEEDSCAPGTPSQEICNNIDDDCDGLTDEDLIQECGIGICQGTQTCIGGYWGACSSNNKDAGICSVCDAFGIPIYDSTQDQDCAQVICPADGCGANNCGINIWGDYPDQIENYCSDIYTCTQNTCNGKAICEIDNDNDGYSLSCGDCDDYNPNTYTGASEICDRLDNDCDGIILDTEIDNDFDGYAECEGDCDDDNDLVYLGAFEECDGLDNDCNGLIDEGYPDFDNDGIADCIDPDDDNDIILDENDKCPETTSWYAEQELNPNHYDSTNLNIADAYGCSCAQVLYCKPGGNNGEFKFGCSAGTKKIWEEQTFDSWALECQENGIVTLAGISKPLLTNTDGTGWPDLFDGDNDGDGMPDSDDDMVEDMDPEGDPDHGIPDWHPKSKHKK